MLSLELLLYVGQLLSRPITFLMCVVEIETF